MHHHSKVHRHATSTTLRCEAASLLSEWGKALPKHKAWIDIDPTRRSCRLLRAHPRLIRPEGRKSGATLCNGGWPSHHHSSWTSKQLQFQRKAAHRLPSGAACRAAWKAVSRGREREHRAWKRTLDNPAARTGWELHLLDDAHWQRKLQQHFQGIFCKAPAERARARLHATHTALTAACKQQRWRPFTDDDLRLATTTWQVGKATGPRSPQGFST